MVDYYIAPTQGPFFYIIIPVIRLLLKSFLDHSQLPVKYMYTALAGYYTHTHTNGVLDHMYHTHTHTQNFA